MITAQDLKIFAASAVGAGAPAINWFVDIAEPIFRMLVLAGQLGVAVATIIYILSKWKKLRDENKDLDDNP